MGATKKENRRDCYRETRGFCLLRKGRSGNARRGRCGRVGGFVKIREGESLAMVETNWTRGGRRREGGRGHLPKTLECRRCLLDRA